MIDHSGYEDIKENSWQRQLHLFEVPFYYIEYGMAIVGALQIWRNSLHDQAAAVAAYRRALALGGTKTLPELFETSGAEFRFDVEMLADLVDLTRREVNLDERVATGADSVRSQEL